jgi:hypothetical protein
MMFKIFYIPAVCLVLCGFSQSVHAQSYRYFDAAGNLHFESQRDEVPSRYENQLAVNVQSEKSLAPLQSRPTRPLSNVSARIPLRGSNVSRGGMMRVWRPRAGYSGISTSRIRP